MMDVNSRTSSVAEEKTALAVCHWEEGVVESEEAGKIK